MEKESTLSVAIRSISKSYDLGLVGTGTLSRDLNRMWARFRGQPDPYAKLHELNDRTQKSTSGSVWALKDISLDIHRGEVLGVIGKNGAGKSTLLKILSQITSPTEGEIIADGRIAALLEVGTGMHPEMTARQNVYLNGAIMGMTRDEISQKMNDIIEFAGVGRYIDTPLKRFSSGMQVRLGFSVAAFLEPEILIVDEVLAVGDAEFQKKAVGKLKEVSSRSERTVIFVSHNMVSLQNLCTRAVVLDKGQMVFNGDTEPAINYYLSSTNQVVSNSLEDLPRKGSGDIRFTRWELSTPDGGYENSGSVAISGAPLKIRLSYEAFKDVNQVIFGIAIYSNLGQTYYSALRSDCVEKLFTISAGNGTIEFSFDKLPFTEGSYSFNLIVRTNYADFDWIERAGSFDVVNGDYYGTGVLPASGRQGVLLDFKVNLNP